jgi:hypothetical protein
VTASEHMRRYAWEVYGEEEFPNSNPRWRSAEASGVVEVDSRRADAGDALVGIIAGRLPDGTSVDMEQAIPWDLFSLRRPIQISFSPVDEDEDP